MILIFPILKLCFIEAENINLITNIYITGSVTIYNITFPKTKACWLPLKDFSTATKGFISVKQTFGNVDISPVFSDQSNLTVRQ